ncbi:MAG: hypothetical protein QXZ44_05660 [Ferroplasma sp.]
MKESEKLIYRKLQKESKDLSIIDYLIGNTIIASDIIKYGEYLVEYENRLIGQMYGNRAIARCAAIALKEGLFAARHGMVSSAFENSRFFLERMSLLKVIDSMGMENNPYELALQLGEWHKLIDAKFVIYSLAQFTGRIRYYYGEDYSMAKISLYVTGSPLCGIHSKPFKKYCKSIVEIENETGIKIDELCSKCTRKATGFAISLPKAGAILSMLGFYTGSQTHEQGKIYADYSRVIHPYGFYSYPKNYLKNLWTLDLIRLISIINRTVFSKTFPE